MHRRPIIGPMHERTLHCGDLDSEDVQRLVAYHFGQMQAASPADACHVLPWDALRDPAVTFWSLREQGHLLAIGALKELSSDHGEIKSMRTAPEFERRGAASDILEAMTAEACRRGYTRLSLETGSSKAFLPALAFYRSHGFASSAPFADYKPTPFTRFLSKELPVGTSGF